MVFSHLLLPSLNHLGYLTEQNRLLIQSIREKEEEKKEIKTVMELERLQFTQRLKCTTQPFDEKLMHSLAEVRTNSVFSSLNF